jgi:hypothetical protein
VCWGGTLSAKPSCRCPHPVQNQATSPAAWSLSVSALLVMRRPKWRLFPLHRAHRSWLSGAPHGGGRCRFTTTRFGVGSKDPSSAQPGGGRAVRPSQHTTRRTAPPSQATAGNTTRRDAQPKGASRSSPALPWRYPFPQLSAGPYSRIRASLPLRYASMKGRLPRSGIRLRAASRRRGSHGDFCGRPPFGPGGMNGVRISYRPARRP